MQIALVPFWQLADVALHFVACLKASPIVFTFETSVLQ